MNAGRDDARGDDARASAGREDAARADAARDNAARADAARDDTTPLPHDCERARDMLLVAFDDALSELDEAELERHLRVCPSCAAECDRLGELRDALAGFPAARMSPAEIERHVAAVRARLDLGHAVDLDDPFEGEEVAASSPRTHAPTLRSPRDEGRRAPWDRRRRAAAFAGDAAAPAVASTHRSWRFAGIAAAAGLLITLGFVAWRLTSTAPTLDVDVTRGASSTVRDVDFGASSTVAEAGGDAQAPRTPVRVDIVDAPAPTTPDVGPSTTPVDLERLASVRAATESALATNAALLAAGDVDGFVANVDEALARYEASKWPLARLVERSLDHADVDVCRAAARWLGRHGDALSARAVADLCADPERKDAALAALIDLGNAGVDTLATLIGDDLIRERVLDDVAPRDPARAATLLERAAKRTARGAATAAIVTEVARRGLAPATSWVEALALERASTDPVTTEACSFALAGIGDVPALRALLRLRAAPRVDPERVDPALTVFLSARGETVSTLVREALAARRSDELRQLDEAMQDAANSTLVPAWLEMAGASNMGRTSRRAAVLAVGQLGSPEDVPALIAVYRATARRDREVRAATLLAVHRLGGVDAARGLLDGLPERTRTRAMAVLATLAERDTSYTNLTDLARELEPQLAPLQL